jgi:hypothetical protein
MVTMESAYYKGELWCAYELKDAKGKYYEEYRLRMRKESQKNAFICPDCGEYLILCAGPIMEPFFKHHENTQCASKGVKGGKNYLNGRRLLYQLAKKSFPHAKITLNKKLSDKYHAGILIETSVEMVYKKDNEEYPNQYQLALEEKDMILRLNLEYLSHDMLIADWEAKHQFFVDNSIIDIWFLSNKKYKKDTIQTFEYLIWKNSSPVLKILCQDEDKIILKQAIVIPEDNSTRIVHSVYDVDELMLSKSGEFDCDFELICDSEKEIINRELLHERLFIEDRIKERQQERKNKVIERELEEGKNDIIKNYVTREKIIDGVSLNSNKMKMTRLGEVWEIPKLVGKEAQIQQATNIRYSYLKKIDKELSEKSKELKNELVNEVIRYLESTTNAKDWLYGKNGTS